MVDDLEKHCGCIDQNSTMTEALQHSNIRRSSAALDKNGKNSSSGVRGSIVISGMRILVVVSLSLLGVYSSITTFRYMKDDEDDHDHQLPDDRIEEYAARVFDSFEKKLGLHLFALDSFASDIYSYSRHEELEWPLVTLPDFELIGSKFRSLTDTSSVSFLPLVTRRNEWESYVVDNGWWMEESLEYVKQTTGFEPLVRDSSMPKNIWDINGYYDTSIGPFLPLWQTSPFVPDASVYNFNALTHPALEGAFKAVLFTGNAVLGDFIDLSSSENEDYLQRLVGTTVEPHGALFYPVFDSYLPKDSNLVGVLFTVLPWQSILEESVMEKHPGEITCVLENSKGEVHTYSITKEGVTYLGASDLHDKLFDAYEQKREVHSLLRDSLKEQAGQPLTDHYIKYTIRVYPSNQAVIEEFDKRDEEVSSGNATLYTSLAAIGFFFVVCLFLFYDYLVDRQQTERVENALKSSLSTSTGVTVQDEPAFQEPQQASETGIEVQASGGMLTPNVSIEYPKEPSKPIPMPASKLLNNYLKDETECAEEEGTVAEAKPIADFFPNCTVVFAELVGFTAWSSQHEPTQVFLLLQEIYQAFDKEAKKRGVFKIESIGDCYVAVTGLPDPQDDHAVRMATFCLECRKITKTVTRKLERSLGPETAELGMRFGLHSGPVTAGVLQGERSRFQLFGDTVNTAARMGNSGHKNLIQASEATALHLIEADRGSWVSQREGTTTVLGKGEMVTYWVDESEVLAKRGAAIAARRSTLSLFSSTLASSISLSGDDSFFNETLVNKAQPRRMLKKARSGVWGKSEVDTAPDASESPRKKMTKRKHAVSATKRLIDWNVDILLGLLKQMAIRRATEPASTISFDGRDLALRDNLDNGKTVLDEVAEIITLPTFDPQLSGQSPPKVDQIEIDSQVKEQLRNYVTAIASMYRDNPFHSYEHACHVQMAMVKLLQRVVSPNDIDYEGRSDEVASDAHKYTYGITSDPLTQFAVVFCALIHDVDHTGVTNGQLVKEGAHIATVYKNKSVAEQNSIDLGWELLMEDDFKELRACIYTSVDEFMRFRQLVVNVVLATDIFDKELSQLRKNRWTKAFTDYNFQESEEDYINRKATIVIEHLIQASDVSHTMQHWDIYRKWNQKLFFEMYVSYTSGRTDSDPSEGWYNGELWFFDNYVIPLAKKLKDCGVFGVSSDECLNYAVENRNMWKAMGEQIVNEMKETDYFASLKSRRKTSRSPKAAAKSGD